MHFFFEKKAETNRTLIEELILQKYNLYYRLAYSYVRSEADAYDIVQNGAYKALKSCHTLKQSEYAETWLYRIMLNECFQQMKRPRMLSYEALQDDGVETGAKQDRYTDVDLHRALNTLSEKDRAVVILKYFEDRKLEEIAAILDENINTVKSRLYRCMKKLRLYLSAANGDSEYSPVQSAKKSAPQNAVNMEVT